MNNDDNWLSPDYWRDRRFEWTHKVFYFVPMTCLFGTPQKVFETSQRLKAEIASKDYKIRENAMLLMQPGSLKGRMMIEIYKPDLYDANVLELEPSRMFSELHEGPVKTVKKTANQLQDRVKKEKGVPVTHTFYWDFRHGPELVGQRADRFVVLCQV
ncbi:MAG: hypothetical protein MAG453_01994 [Calditrichaeota bacterium]|nr:hypothetical protein [Calditrichota bacterium]